jgi:hypothetical protein
MPPVVEGQSGRCRNLCCRTRMLPWNYVNHNMWLQVLQSHAHILVSKILQAKTLGTKRETMFGFMI